MSRPLSAPVFRDARHEEVPAIVALLADDALGRSREAFGASAPVDPAYAAAFEAIERDPNNRLIVADLEGEVAGCMQLTTIPHLTFKGGTRLQIEGVRVKERFRSRKIGAAMIDWAIAVARAESCHLVQLTCNRERGDARRFYESRGFTPTHVGFKLYLP
ncbi:MAG: GNAT family N-acetyltransferase [Geminicoccaceae bacterium]